MEKHATSIGVTLADNGNFHEQAREWASVLSDPEVRKLAEDAAEIVLGRGYGLPTLKEASLPKGKLAAFDATDNTITISNRKPKGGWSARMEELENTGWHSHRNSILHEFGHYIHSTLDRYGYDSRNPYSNRVRPTKEVIERNLSKYAATSPLEYEAELIAGVLSGKVYPKEIIDYSFLRDASQHGDPRSWQLRQMADGSIANTATLGKDYSKMMQAVYHQQGSSFKIEILADSGVQDFITAHAKALDNGFRFVPMSDAMRQRLERSNWIFSGIKTFHELNEAFPSLINEDGTRKPFERFLNDVQRIDETYNRNYLRSEYNFVHASADMAAKWEEFAADGDRYYLQYRTAQDDRVRPEHADLDGVTLPIDDPFWASYYPPNGWNCRCTVVQVRKGKYEATPHDEAIARGEAALQRDTRGIFRFNSGIEQKTVPDYNPYTISRCNVCPVAKDSTDLKLAFAPTSQLCAACKLVRQCYSVAGKQVKEWREELKTSGEMPTQAELKNGPGPQTGKMLMSDSVLERFLGHCRSVPELDAARFIWKHPEELHNPVPSPFGEGKDPERDRKNLSRKKKRGVVAYTGYSFDYKGKTWHVKIETHRNGFEQFYAITK